MLGDWLHTKVWFLWAVNSASLPYQPKMLIQGLVQLIALWSSQESLMSPVGFLWYFLLGHWGTCSMWPNDRRSAEKGTAVDCVAKCWKAQLTSSFTYSIAVESMFLSVCYSWFVATVSETITSLFLKESWSKGGISPLLSFMQKCHNFPVAMCAFCWLESRILYKPA